MRRHNLALLAVAPLLALGLTACGSDGGGNAGATVTATTASDQEKARQFAKCMRANGIDMPDPETDSKGNFVVRGGGGAEKGKARSANSAKFENAMKKCRHLLPNGGSPQPLSPEDQEKMRQFAKCMRQHGIDMPDPDPNGGGFAIGKRGGINPDDDKFEEAQKACEQYMPKARKAGSAG